MSLLVLVGLASGCARRSEGAQASLRDAVDRFWIYRMEGESGAIFDEVVDQDTRRRYGNDRAKYVRSRGGIEYLTYEIVDVTAEGSRGHARVRYEWTATSPDPKIREAFESHPPFKDIWEGDWVLENGEWRLVWSPPFQSKSARAKGEGTPRGK